MQLSDLATLLRTIQGFQNKVAYRAFPVGESPDPPFLVYYYLADDPFNADNLVFYASQSVRVEFYSDFKDEATEALIEAKFDFPYTKETVYIDDELLYETIYEFDLRRTNNA